MSVSGHGKINMAASIEVCCQIDDIYMYIPRLIGCFEVCRVIIRIKTDHSNLG